MTLFLCFKKICKNLEKQILKVVNGSSPKIINEVFQSQKQNNNNVINNSTFRNLSFNATLKGKEIVSHLNPKILTQLFLESVLSSTKPLKKL